MGWLAVKVLSTPPRCRADTSAWSKYQTLRIRYLAAVTNLKNNTFEALPLASTFAVARLPKTEDRRILAQSQIFRLPAIAHASRFPNRSSQSGTTELQKHAIV